MNTEKKAPEISGVKSRVMRLGAIFTMAATVFTTALQPVAYTETSAADDTIKIMPLGDSITFGMADDGGYRKYLSYLLQQNGYKNVDLVGPEGKDSATFNYNGQSVTYDDNHAGYSGYTITDLPGGWMGKLNGILETMQKGDYIKKYSPDIILLQIGTNDISNGHLDGSEERLHQLLDYLKENMPSDGKIFLTTIPDLGNTFGGSTNNDIAKYNELVKKVAGEYSSKNVIYADIHSVIDASKDLADGVHPNAGGYEKMGKYWFSQIESYLSSPSLGTSAPPASQGDQAEGSEKTTLISSDFESGADGWTGRGSASAAVSKSSAHTGSSALSVTSRAETWNGATKTLGSGFTAGSTYSFEAYVRFDSGSSEETFKLSLQYSDGGTVKYADIAKAAVKKGEWTKLSNDKYTIPAGASDLQFYVETADSTVDFFIDDVKVTGDKSAAPSTPSVTPSVKAQRGDLNDDGVIDSLDLVRLRKLVLGGNPLSADLKRGDIDGDKLINETDIRYVADFILGKIDKFPEIQSSSGSRDDYEKVYDFPSPSSFGNSSDIPDPFIFMDGSAVQSPDDWYRRANEISCMYEYYMYGKWRDGSDDEVTYSISGNKMTINIKRKSTGKTTSFPANINLPSKVRHDGGAPVIIGMHDGIAESTATAQGYAVITVGGNLFSNPVASDDTNHQGAFYDLYPYGNTWEEQTGVLMAWSWGCSKILDALYNGAAQELNINPDSSIVTGVSRWGKATAVCGAFDQRFKMVAPSCSGAGGLALYRYMSEGKTYDFSSKGASSRYTYGQNEPLGSLQSSGERGWFNNRFLEFKDAKQFPMDQHMLGSLVADPDRYLFIIGSCVSEDWVNAPSMWMSYNGMKHVWDYLGISDNIAINIHKEGHAVIEEDVKYMCQYFDYHVYGIQPTMDLGNLQTSVFDLPANKDPFQDTFTSKWLY